MSRQYGTRIVAIGGGTGLSVMLRGLKAYSENICAVVAVSDDGGGSGMLREDLGMPPPGDVRNCLKALANTEQLMEELLDYRFSEGCLKGQSFGNLFLAALNGMSRSFDEAVYKMSQVLAITGRVLPVSNEDIRLSAVFNDGTIVDGESHIAEYKQGNIKRIEKVFLRPDKPKAVPEVIETIEKAELIIMGPGSLYTSVIPNLLVDGVSAAIKRSKAMKIYVMNLMTQEGETEDCTASEHVKAVFNAAEGKVFDYVIADVSRIPSMVLAKYVETGNCQVVLDREKLAELGVELVERELAVWKNALVRHDPNVLAREIMAIYRELSETKVY